MIGNELKTNSPQVDEMKGGKAISRINSPLKWHIDGGKHYLASRIVALMPAHIHYVEPYAGSLAVLLAKDPAGVSEVVNDLNGELMAFWRILQDPTNYIHFCRMATFMPFSEAAWQDARDLLARQIHVDPVRRAVAFLVACRQSLAGRMKEFATLSRRRTRRGLNEQASAWLSAVEGLPEVHARLKRVVILTHDALDVIRQQDGPETLFYLDPTYYHPTRATTTEYGQYEMTERQHKLLLALLSQNDIGDCNEQTDDGTPEASQLAGCLEHQLQGKFLLSGYRSPLYDVTAELNGWNRYDFELPNNAAGGQTKRRMIECVWCNF